MHAIGTTMHIDRANEIAVARKAAGAADPISILGFVAMPTARTPARCPSFGAGEARDVSLLGFVSEVVDVLAVLPQGHALVVVTTSITVTNTVRVADEERSHVPLHAEVNHLTGRFVPQIADTPLGSAAVLVPGALQLLPAPRVLLAPALLFGELAQLPAALPLERANAAPGHDHCSTRIRRHSGQVDFPQVYRRLDGAGSLFRLGNFDADMQSVTPVPAERAGAALFRQREWQGESGSSSAHRQDHPSFFFVDGLCGPLNRIELFRAPGILHAHLWMRLAKLSRGVDIGEEGVDNHLHGLAMQPIPSFSRPLQFVPPRPLHMREARLLVRLHAHVPDPRRLLLCGFQFVHLARRQMIEPIHAHGFHMYVFFFSARKAVMCRSEGKASGVAFIPPPERGGTFRSFFKLGTERGSCISRSLRHRSLAFPRFRLSLCD
jgi:hypothetical protein